MKKPPGEGNDVLDHRFPPCNSPREDRFPPKGGGNDASSGEPIASHRFPETMLPIDSHRFPTFPGNDVDSPRLNSTSEQNDCDAAVPEDSFRAHPPASKEPDAKRSGDTNTDLGPTGLALARAVPLSGKFRVGRSGNPGGRPRLGPQVYGEFVKACRAATPRALEVLSQIILRFLDGDPTVKANDAIKAAEVLFNRGFGTPSSTVALPDAEQGEPMAVSLKNLSVEELQALASITRKLDSSAPPAGLSEPGGNDEEE